MYVYMYVCKALPKSMKLITSIVDKVLCIQYRYTALLPMFSPVAVSTEHNYEPISAKTREPGNYFAHIEMCCTTLVCKNDATNNPQSFHYRSSLSRPTKETKIMTCLSIFSSHFSLCFFTMYVLSTILCAHLFVKLLYVYNYYVCRKMCRCKNHLIFMLYLQAGRLGNETRMY